MLLSMQIAVSTTMYMVPPYHLPPRPQTSRSLLGRDKLFPTCASSEFLKRHSQLPSASVTKHVTTSLPNLSNGTVSIVTQFSTQAFTSNSLHSVHYSLLLQVSATGYDQVQGAANFFVEVCSFLKMTIVAS